MNKTITFRVNEIKISSDYNKESLSISPIDPLLFQMEFPENFGTVSEQGLILNAEEMRLVIKKTEIALEMLKEEF